MTNVKLTELTELAEPAVGDKTYIVDVSDTTESAGGTSKRTTIQIIADFLASLAQTLTNKTLTTPKITTSINDANGNEVIKTPATTSAVNEITVTNSATGVYPQISATGDDANIGLRIVSKGTEVIKLKSGDTPTYGHIVPSVADDTVALLAATQVLTNKTIASHLAYADTRYKVGSFTRAQDGTSADVSYTGIGFQPKAIIFMSTPAVTNMTTYSSWGFDDGTSHFGSVIRSAVNGPISGNSIFYGDGAAEQKGYIKTFDADGFTITWTKTGTPASGNIQVYFLALR